MKKGILAAILILGVLMTSCSIGVGAATTYNNEEIDRDVLNATKTLDEKVLQSIKDNDVDAILDISSEDLKNESSNIIEMMSQIHELVNDRTFEYLGRYYSRVKELGNYNFTIHTSEDDPFVIHMDAFAPDIFVSLLKTNSKVDDWLLTLVYVKQENDWKLRVLYIGDYSYHGMTAIDLYEKAKLSALEGTVPAALYLSLSSRTMHPSPYMRYKREGEIADYTKEVFDSFNDEYIFPIQLMNASNVELYGFDVRVVQQGLVPVIKYNPGIDISQEEEVNNIAEEIHTEVTSLYPGLKENFEMYLYEAYSEPPIDPQKEYRCFRTVVE